MSFDGRRVDRCQTNAGNSTFTTQAPGTSQRCATARTTKSSVDGLTSKTLRCQRFLASLSRCPRRSLQGCCYFLGPDLEFLISILDPWSNAGGCSDLHHAMPPSSPPPGHVHATVNPEPTVAKDFSVTVEGTSAMESTRRWGSTRSVMARTWRRSSGAHSITGTMLPFIMFSTC